MTGSFRGNNQPLAEIDFGIKVNPTFDTKEVLKAVETKMNSLKKDIESAITVQSGKSSDGREYARQLKELYARFDKDIAKSVTHIISAFNSVSNTFKTGDYGHVAITESVKDLGKAISKAIGKQVEFGKDSADDIAKALANVDVSKVNRAELKNLAKTHLVSSQQAINNAINKRLQENLGLVESTAKLEREFVASIQGSRDAQAIIRKQEDQRRKLTRSKPGNTAIRSALTSRRDVKKLDAEVGQWDAKLKIVEQDITASQAVVDRIAAQFANPATELATLASDRKKTLQALMSKWKQQGGILLADGSRPRKSGKTQAEYAEWERLDKEITQYSKDLADFTSSSTLLSGATGVAQQLRAQLEPQRKLLAEARARLAKSTYVRPIKTRSGSFTADEKKLLDELEGLRAGIGEKGAAVKGNYDKIKSNSNQIDLLRKFKADFEGIVDSLFTQVYSGLNGNLKAFNTELEKGIKTLLGSSSTPADRSKALSGLITNIEHNIKGITSSGDSIIAAYGAKLQAFQAYLKNAQADPSKLQRLPQELLTLQETFRSYGSDSNSYGLQARGNFKSAMESPFKGRTTDVEGARKAAEQLSKALTIKAVEEAENILKNLNSNNSASLKEGANKLLNVANGVFSSVATQLLEVARKLDTGSGGLPELLKHRESIANQRATVRNQIAGLPDGLDKRVQTAYSDALGVHQTGVEKKIELTRNRTLDDVRQVFEYIQKSERDVASGAQTAEGALSDFGVFVHGIADKVKKVDEALSLRLLALSNSTRIYAGGKQEGLFDNVIKQTAKTLGLHALDVQQYIGVRDGSVESVRNLENTRNNEVAEKAKQDRIASKFAAQDRDFNKYYADLDANLLGFNTRLGRLMGVILADTASAGQRESAIHRTMDLIVSNIDAIEKTGNKELVGYAKSLAAFHTYMGATLADPNKLKNLPEQAAKLYNAFNPYAVDSRPVEQKVAGAGARSVLKGNLQAPFRDNRFNINAANKAAEVLNLDRLTKQVEEAESIFRAIGSSANPADLRAAATDLLDIKNSAFRSLANNLLQTADILERVGPNSSLADLVKAKRLIESKQTVTRTDLNALPGGLGTRLQTEHSGAYAAAVGAFDSDIDAHQKTITKHLNDLFKFAETKQNDIKAGTTTADKALKEFGVEAQKVAHILSTIDPNIASRVGAMGNAATNYTGAGQGKQFNEGKQVLNEIAKSSGLKEADIKAMLTRFDTGITALTKIEEDQQQAYKDNNTATQKAKAAAKKKMDEERLTALNTHVNSVRDISALHPLPESYDVSRINSGLQTLNQNHRPVTVDELNKHIESRIKTAVQGNKRKTEIDELGDLAQSFGLEKTLKNLETVAESGIYAMSRRIKQFGYQVFQETFSNLSSLIAFQLGRMLGDAYKTAQQIEDVVNDVSSVTVTETGIVQKSKEVSESQGRLRNAIAGAGVVFTGGTAAAMEYTRGLYDLSYSTDTIATKLVQMSRLAKIAHRDLGDITKAALPIDKLYGINNTEVGTSLVSAAINNNVSIDKASENFTKLAGNKDIRASLTIEEMQKYAIASAKMGREVETNVTAVVHAVEGLSNMKIEGANLGKVNNSFFVSTEALRALGIQFNEFLGNIKKSGIGTIFTGLAFALHTAIVPLELVTKLLAGLTNSQARPFVEIGQAVVGAALGFGVLHKALTLASTALGPFVLRFTALGAAATSGLGGALLSATGLLRVLGPLASGLASIAGVLAGPIGMVVALGAALYSLGVAWANHNKEVKEAALEAEKATKTIEERLDALARSRELRLGIKVDTKNNKFIEQLASGQLDLDAKLAGLDSNDVLQLIKDNPKFLADRGIDVDRLTDLTKNTKIAQDAVQVIQTSIGSITTAIGNSGGPFGQLASNMIAASIAAKDMQVAINNMKGPATEQALALLRGPVNQFNAAAVQANMDVQVATSQYWMQEEYNKNRLAARANTQSLNESEREQANAGDEVTWTEGRRDDLRREYGLIVNATQEEREAFEAEDKKLFEQRKAALLRENAAIKEINRLRENQFLLEDQKYQIDKARLTTQKNVYTTLKNQYVDTNTTLTEDALRALNIDPSERTQILSMTSKALRQYIDNMISGVNERFNNLAQPTRQRPLQLKKVIDSYDGTDYTKRLKNNSQTINGDDIVKSTLDVLQNYANANKLLIDSPEAASIRQAVSELERAMVNKDGVIWAQGRVQSLEGVKKAVEGYKLLLDNIEDTDRVLRDIKFAGLTETDPVKKTAAQLDALRGGIDSIKTATSKFLAQGITDPKQFSATAGGLEAGLTKIMNTIRTNFENLGNAIVNAASNFTSRIENSQDNIKLRRLKNKMTAGMTNPFDIAEAEARAEAQVQLERDQRDIKRIQDQIDLQKQFVDQVTASLGEWRIAINENTKALKGTMPTDKNYVPPVQNTSRAPEVPARQATEADLAATASEVKPDTTAATTPESTVASAPDGPNPMFGARVGWATPDAPMPPPSNKVPPVTTPAQTVVVQGARASTQPATGNQPSTGNRPNAPTQPAITPVDIRDGVNGGLGDYINEHDGLPTRPSKPSNRDTDSDNDDDQPGGGLPANPNNQESPFRVRVPVIIPEQRSPVQAPGTSTPRIRPPLGNGNAPREEPQTGDAPVQIPPVQQPTPAYVAVLASVLESLRQVHAAIAGTVELLNNGMISFKASISSALSATQNVFTEFVKTLTGIKLPNFGKVEVDANIPATVNLVVPNDISNKLTIKYPNGISDKLTLKLPENLGGKLTVSIPEIRIPKLPTLSVDFSGIGQALKGALNAIELKVAPMVVMTPEGTVLKMSANGGSNPTSRPSGASTSPINTATSEPAKTSGKGVFVAKDILKNGVVDPTKVAFSKLPGAVGGIANAANSPLGQGVLGALMAGTETFIEDKDRKEVIGNLAAGAKALKPLATKGIQVLQSTPWVVNSGSVYLTAKLTGFPEGSSVRWVVVSSTAKNGSKGNIQPVSDQANMVKFTPLQSGTYRIKAVAPDNTSVDYAVVESMYANEVDKFLKKKKGKGVGGGTANAGTFGVNPTEVGKSIATGFKVSADSLTRSVSSGQLSLDDVPSHYRSEVAFRAANPGTVWGQVAHGSPFARQILADQNVRPGITNGSYSYRTNWTHAGLGSYFAQDNATADSYADTDWRHGVTDPNDKGAVSTRIAFPKDAMKEFNERDWRLFVTEYVSKKLGNNFQRKDAMPTSSDYLKFRNKDGMYANPLTTPDPKVTAKYWENNPSMLKHMYSLTKEQFISKWIEQYLQSPAMSTVYSRLSNDNDPLSVEASEAYNAQARAKGVKVWSYTSSHQNNPTHYNVIDPSIIGELQAYDTKTETIKPGFTPVEGNFNENVSFSSANAAKKFYQDPRATYLNSKMKWFPSQATTPEVPTSGGIRLPKFNVGTLGSIGRSLGGAADSLGMVGDVVGGLAERASGAQAWLPPGLDQVPAYLGLSKPTRVYEGSRKIFVNKVSQGFTGYRVFMILGDSLGGTFKPDLAAELVKGKGNVTITNGTDSATLAVKAYAPGVVVKVYSKNNPKVFTLVNLPHFPNARPGVGGGKMNGVGTGNGIDYLSTPQGQGKVVHDDYLQGFGSNKTTLPLGVAYSSIPGLDMNSFDPSKAPANHEGIDMVFDDGNVFNAFNGAKVVKVNAGDGLDGISGNADDGAGDGFGKSIVLELENGVRLLLAHFAEVMVKAGDTLGLGELMGIQGHSGNADGDHVHAQVADKFGNTILNPELAKNALVQAAAAMNSADRKSVTPYIGGGLTDQQAIPVRVTNDLKPETDTIQYTGRPEITEPGSILVSEGTKAAFTKDFSVQDRLLKQAASGLNPMALDVYKAKNDDITDEKYANIAKSIIASQVAFINSLKGVLQSGITKLLTLPTEYFKRLNAKAEVMKDLAFQGGSIEAQKASLQSNLIDVTSKRASAKTVEEYNSYTTQIQGIESSLRDVNTQYAVWQENMRRTKEEGLKFGDFFADMFEDLGTQIGNLFAERASNIFMAGLFNEHEIRNVAGSSSHFKTYKDAENFINTGDGKTGVSVPLGVGGGLASSDTYGVKYPGMVEEHLKTISDNTGKAVDVQVETQGITKNGFMQSLGAALESLAIQAAISIAINIFRAAMTKRESDSVKFTAPLDFDTTRGTANPSGIRQLTVNTTVNGANAAEVSRISANEVDKGMNKLRFGV